MITRLNIQNFKSIRQLTLNCKRVNLIVGQPNTGKSNILEALSLFSPANTDLKKVIRYRELSNLFFDNDVSQRVTVETDNLNAQLFFENDNFNFADNKFSRIIRENDFFQHEKLETNVLNYKFFPIDKFIRVNPAKLQAPHGENLFEILYSNPSLRDLTASVFAGLGYKLQLRTQGLEIEFVKEENNILITYPWQSLSDTIQRVIFYNAVIDSNKESVILLEEPEANTFPLYTKLMGEKISLDNTNQYFIVTHNPFLLLSIIDKTPVHDLNFFITEYANYETSVKEVQADELPKILELDSDVFLNLNKFGK